MIFVTVGTHEQPFNRLVKALDDMKQSKEIGEEIVIQTGYSTYEPKCCNWQKFYAYQDMVELVKKARIVITHGGPSSFIMPLQIGKMPIVVPRKKVYDEHVNDHQVDFCREVVKRMGIILLVEEMDELRDTILNYEGIIASRPAGMQSNNVEFNGRLSEIADELVGIK